MPQNLAKILIQLAFSTKHHQPLIDSELEQQLFPYMAKIFRECDSPGLVMNGTKDHIHVLFLLSKKIALCDVIEDVKKNSSKWAKTKRDAI